MKKLVTMFLSFLIMFGSCVIITSKSASALADVEETIISNVTVKDDFKPGSVIVILKKSATKINKKHKSSAFSGVQIEEINDLSAIDNEEAMAWIDQENYHQILEIVLKDKSKEGVVEAVQKLQKKNAVLKVLPNYNVRPVLDDDYCAEICSMVYPNDPNVYTSSQVNASNIKTPYIQIDLPTAWGISIGSSGFCVGVLDYGIEPTHEELRNNVDTSLGANFTDDGLGAWVDPHGHGTFVAGVIAAAGNNGKGIAGVCWATKLVSIRVFKKTESDAEAPGTLSWVAEGIQYAVNNQIPILNYSGAGNVPLVQLEDVIVNYPGLLITAAGNENQDVDVSGKEKYPACFTENNIISVAAVDAENTLWYKNEEKGSNWGVNSVDLAAPGVDIYSTWINNSYHQDSGTSAATPFVTGVAALIKSIRPDLSAQEIRDIILETVSPAAALQGKVATGGVVNAYNALAAARAYPERGELLSGDFDGDLKTETAAFYQDGANLVLRIWDTTDKRYDMLSGTLGYTSTTYSLPKMEGRIVAGDFNNDGYDDIAALYDLGVQPDGSYKTQMVVWRSLGNSKTFVPYVVAQMPQFEAARVTDRVAAGDFNGDGYFDMAGIYDCGIQDTGHYMMQGWVWEGSSDYSFSHSVKFQSGWFNSNNLTGRVTAGDYNGDGYDDVAAFYDYGVQSNGHSMMKLFVWNGQETGNYTEYIRCQSDWYDASKLTGRVVSGDFNNDGYDDIAGFYDYGLQSDGTYLTKIWYFRGVSMGSTMSHSVGYTAAGFSAEGISQNVYIADPYRDGTTRIRVYYQDEFSGTLWEYTGSGSSTLTAAKVFS